MCLKRLLTVARRRGTYDQLCRERFERLLQRAFLNQVERHAGRFLRHFDGLLTHGGQAEVACVDAIVVADDGNVVRHGESVAFQLEQQWHGYAIFLACNRGRHVVEAEQLRHDFADVVLARR